MGVPAWSSRSAQSARQALGVKPEALCSFIYSPEINNHSPTPPNPATDLHPLFLLPAMVSGNHRQEQIPGISIYTGEPVFVPLIYSGHQSCPA